MMRIALLCRVSTFKASGSTPQFDGCHARELPPHGSCGVKPATQVGTMAAQCKTSPPPVALSPAISTATPMPIKVVAFTGSLRKASVNAGLLRAAATLAPKHDMEFIIVSADLPLYNGDLEEAGAAGDAHVQLLASMQLGRRSCSHNTYQQAYPSPSKLCAPNLPQLTLYFSASKNSTTLCQVIAAYLHLCHICTAAEAATRPCRSNASQRVLQEFSRTPSIGPAAPTKVLIHP